MQWRLTLKYCLSTFEVIGKIAFISKISKYYSFWEKDKKLKRIDAWIFLYLRNGLLLLTVFYESNQLQKKVFHKIFYDNALIPIIRGDNIKINKLWKFNSEYSRQLTNIAKNEATNFSNRKVNGSWTTWRWKKEEEACYN